MAVQKTFNKKPYKQNYTKKSPNTDKGTQSYNQARPKTATNFLPAKYDGKNKSPNFKKARKRPSTKPAGSPSARKLYNMYYRVRSMLHWARGSARVKRVSRRVEFAPKVSDRDYAAALLTSRSCVRTKLGRKNRSVGCYTPLGGGRSVLFSRESSLVIARRLRYASKRRRRGYGPRPRLGRKLKIRVLIPSRDNSSIRSPNLLDVRNLSQFIANYRSVDLKRSGAKWKRIKLNKLAGRVSLLSSPAISKQNRILVGIRLRLQRLRLNFSSSRETRRAVAAQRRLRRLRLRRPRGLFSASKSLLKVSRRIIFLLRRVDKLRLSPLKGPKSIVNRLNAVNATLMAIIPSKLEKKKVRRLRRAARARYLTARSVSRVIWQFLSSDFRSKLTRQARKFRRNCKRKHVRRRIRLNRIRQRRAIRKVPVAFRSAARKLPWLRPEFKSSLRSHRYYLRNCRDAERRNALVVPGKKALRRPMLKPRRVTRRLRLRRRALYNKKKTGKIRRKHRPRKYRWCWGPRVKRYRANITTRSTTYFIPRSPAPQFLVRPFSTLTRHQAGAVTKVLRRISVSRRRRISKIRRALTMLRRIRKYQQSKRYKYRKRSRITPFFHGQLKKIRMSSTASLRQRSLLTAMPRRRAVTDSREVIFSKLTKELVSYRAFRRAVRRYTRKRRKAVHRKMRLAHRVKRKIRRSRARVKKTRVSWRRIIRKLKTLHNLGISNTRVWSNILQGFLRSPVKRKATLWKHVGKYLKNHNQTTVTRQRRVLCALQQVRLTAGKPGVGSANPRVFGGVFRRLAATMGQVGSSRGDELTTIARRAAYRFGVGSRSSRYIAFLAAGDTTSDDVRSFKRWLFSSKRGAVVKVALARKMLKDARRARSKSGLSQASARRSAFVRSRNYQQLKRLVRYLGLKQKPLKRLSLPTNYGVPSNLARSRMSSDSRRVIARIKALRVNTKQRKYKKRLSSILPQLRAVSRLMVPANTSRKAAAVNKLNRRSIRKRSLAASRKPVKAKFKQKGRVQFANQARLKTAKKLAKRVRRQKLRALKYNRTILKVTFGLARRLQRIRMLRALRERPALRSGFFNHRLRLPTLEAHKKFYRHIKVALSLIKTGRLRNAVNRKGSRRKLLSLAPGTGVNHTRVSSLPTSILSVERARHAMSYLHTMFTSHKGTRPSARRRAKKAGRRRRSVKRRSLSIVKQGPTPRVLRRRNKYFRRARQARRRYTTALFRSALDPFINSTAFLPTRYDYDMRAGLLSKRKRRRLVGQARTMLQWAPDSAKVRNSLLRRQPLLRLVTSGPHRPKILRTSTASRRESLRMAFPVFRSTGIFPWHPKRLRASTKRTDSHLTPKASQLANVILRYSQMSLHSRIRRRARKALHAYKPKRRKLNKRRFRSVYKHIQPKAIRIRRRKLRRLRSMRPAILGARRTKWSLRWEDRRRRWSKVPKWMTRGLRPKRFQYKPVPRKSRGQRKSRVRRGLRRFSFLKKTRVPAVSNKLAEFSSLRRYSALIKTPGTLAKSVNRQKARQLLTQLPYVAQGFSIRSHSRRHGYLHSPQGAARFRSLTVRRKIKDLQLRQDRAYSARLWSKQNTPLRKTSSLPFEERYRRDIYRRRARVFGRLETMTSYEFPTVHGNRRARRVFAGRFAKNYSQFYKTSLPHFSTREIGSWISGTATPVTSKKTALPFRLTSPNIINWQNSSLGVNLLTSGSSFLSYKPLSDASGEAIQAQSVSRHLKLSNSQHTVTVEDYENPTYVTTGVDVPRFPAVALYNYTYEGFIRRRVERLLHAGVKRTAPTRQKRLRLSTSENFMSFSPQVETSVHTRRSVEQAAKAAVFSYCSKRARIARRRSFSNAITAVKRKAISLPPQVQTAPARGVRKIKRRHGQSASVLMQTALHDQLAARRLKDLRGVVGRRRGLYSSRMPFWVRRAAARRVKKLVGHVPYGLVTSKYAAATKFYWKINGFLPGFPRRQAKHFRRETSIGERFYEQEYLTPLPFGPILKPFRLRSRLRKWKRGYNLARRFGARRGRRKIRSYRRVKKRFLRKRKGVRRKLRFYKGARSLAVRSIRSTFRRNERARKNRTFKLISATRTPSILSPLHFRREILTVPASAEEKERLYLYTRELKKEQYSKLIAASDTVTALFPQLISKIIDKKDVTTSLTYSDAAALVQSTYWNLRMYLKAFQQGPKAYARRRALSRLKDIGKDMAYLGASNPFSLQDLRVARFRFQPSTTKPARSFKRGKTEWLRRFLPKFYELILEDPIKYGHLTVTHTKVLRSHLNCAAITKWPARAFPGSMENQLTRLTTSRSDANSASFENMLMTTRRTPALGGYGAAATLRVVNPVGLSSARTSFFSRRFSTAAVGAAVFSPDSTLLLVRAAALDRGSDLPNSLISSNTYISQTVAFKAKAVAAAQAKLLPSHPSNSAWAADIRLHRLKSPRNAEYLQRLTESTGLEPAADVQPRGGQQFAYRTARAFLYKSLTTRRTQSNHTTIRFTRSTRLTRRTTTALFSQPRPAARRKYKRLLSYGPRIRNQTKREFLVRWASSVNKARFQPRSILHYRRAAKRSPYLHYTPSRVILPRTVRLSAPAKFVLKLKKFNKRVARKLLYNRGRYNYFARPLVYRTLPRKKRSKIGKKIRSHKNTLKFRPVAYAVPRRTSIPKTGFLTSPLSALRRTGKARAVHFKAKFRASAREARDASRVFSSNVRKAEIGASRIVFSVRRQELWDELTLRHMKKARILKNWLKITKYYFKEKGWARAIRSVLSRRGGPNARQTFFSDVLFRESRRRLRKLEWRESDEKFNRHGLRYAFSFHPREKKYGKWLEPILLKRSIYTTLRGEYRRHQFPREQKARKWLQQFRKGLLREKLSHTHVNNRRWHALRLYNQRLHRSLFHIRNAKAALKRFRKLSRLKPKKTGFERLTLGFGDRLDVNLILMNIAPTVFWARQMVNCGLLRINGKVVHDPNFRFTPGDYIEFMWSKVEKYKSYFKRRRVPFGREFNVQSIIRSLRFPGNFTYHHRLRSGYYNRLPNLQDLPENSRFSARLFRWYQLDSGLGH